MNNDEYTHQHAGIHCKHDLKIPDFETFARELSQKLNLNIEMRYQRSPFLHNKTISRVGTTEKAYLEEKCGSLIPETRYELGQNEFKLVIFEDFISVDIEITVDYLHVLQLYNENILLEIELFKTIVNQLKILGINEINIFGFDEFEIGQNKNYCWKNVIAAIKKCDNNFVIKL